MDYRKLFDLRGKTAVITGANGIIGSEAAKAFAAYGANVALMDIKAKETDILADEIKSRFGTDARSIHCDVTSESSVANAVGDAIKIFGSIDILNTCAVFGENSTDLYASFEGYSFEMWRRCMSVNVDGMFLVTRAVGNEMIKSGASGSIILMSSIYGMLGPDNRIYEESLYDGVAINTPGHYSLSKGGVISFARYLATTWARHNIRVNCVTPGGVFSGQNNVFVDKYSSRVPLGRMARADEIAAAILFLASDASSYITGQNIIVDGGYSAW